MSDQRPAILAPEASIDFDRHHHWYRQNRPEAEYRFVTAIFEALDTIAAHPDAFALVGPDVRHARTKGFPYALYYRTSAEETVVFAVHHNKQDPKVWQSRS